MSLHIAYTTNRLKVCIDATFFTHPHLKHLEFKLFSLVLTLLLSHVERIQLPFRKRLKHEDKQN